MERLSAVPYLSRFLRPPSFLTANLNGGVADGGSTLHLAKLELPSPIQRAPVRRLFGGSVYLPRRFVSGPAEVRRTKAGRFTPTLSVGGCGLLGEVVLRRQTIEKLTSAQEVRTSA